MHKENTYQLNSSSWLSTWSTKCLLVLMYVYTYTRNSVFVSSGDEYLGKLLEFHKECQVPFRVSRGNVEFLLKRCSVKGPHLTWRGEFCGFCQVVYTYVYTHTYTYIYVYVHICMYIHVCIHIYTYVYIHICVWSQPMESKRVGHDWERQQAAWYFYYFYCTWWSNIHFVLCYAKVLQSCPTLSNSMDLSPPGPSVHGIIWARILE